MTETPDLLRRQARLPDGPAAAALLLQPLLAEAVGEGAEAVSLTLDFGAPAQAGDPVSIEAWIDRATRTLVFAHARIVAGSGGLVASGSAVFRRPAAPSPASAAGS